MKRLLILASTFLLTSACSESGPLGVPEQGAALSRGPLPAPVEVRALTRNLYVGGDISRVFGAVDPVAARHPNTHLAVPIYFWKSRSPGGLSAGSGSGWRATHMRAPSTGSPVARSRPNSAGYGLEPLRQSFMAVRPGRARLHHSP